MFTSVLCVVLVVGIASASLLQDLGLGQVERHNGLQRRQMMTSNSTCRLNYTTNLWSSCAQVLQEFNLTLDAFEDVNPTIGINCTNFVPGSTYCIAAGLSHFTWIFC